jgi:hypothetical protein
LPPAVEPVLQCPFVLGISAELGIVWRLGRLAKEWFGFARCMECLPSWVWLWRCPRLWRRDEPSDVPNGLGSSVFAGIEGGKELCMGGDWGRLWEWWCTCSEEWWWCVGIAVVGSE